MKTTYKMNDIVEIIDDLHKRLSEIKDKDMQVIADEYRNKIQASNERLKAAKKVAISALDELSSMKTTRKESKLFGLKTKTTTANRQFDDEEVVLFINQKLEEAKIGCNACTHAAGREVKGRYIAIPIPRKMRHDNFTLPLYLEDKRLNLDSLDDGSEVLGTFYGISGLKSDIEANMSAEYIELDEDETKTITTARMIIDNYEEGVVFSFSSTLLTP